MILLPSVDTCVHRVATRSHHEFTDEAAARHMHTQFATAEIDARHVITEPTETVDRVADRIDELLVAGTLRYP